MKTKRFYLLLVVVFAMMLIVACGAPAAAPTATPIPPTSVPPTDTPIPPTATPIPPESETLTEDDSPAPTPLVSDKPKLESGEITSEALAGNLVGDPATKPYYIILPPGYDDTDTRYPVVYVLHWYTGDELSLTMDVFSTANELRTNGEIQDMIYVFPNANNKFGGSWYMSSPTIGDYETYLTQELVDHIDATYRTIPLRSSRGITGCSDGGHGAMHLALSFPDMYNVVAGVSGTYDYENDPLWEIARSLADRVPENLEDIRLLPWQVQWYMAGAAATSANPDVPPFFFELPFEVEDGEPLIVKEVAEKINASDTVHDLLDYLEQPTKLSAIMLYHGESDQIASVELVRSFDEMLTEAEVDHEYLEVSGGHCNLSYEPVIQFMSDHLVHETAETEVVKEPPDILSGYADNDGVKIHYEVEGEGPPLVLMHWFNGSTEDWRMFGYVDALKEDYQLILIDMRGHGQSDKPHERAAYDAEVQANDIVAVLDELDIDKAHYFGYSLGATLGWALAKYAPERFASFIIGGEGPASHDPSEWNAYIRGLGAENMAYMVEDGAREHGVWHPGIHEAYATNDLNATLLASEELNIIDFSNDVPGMQTPILLLAGSEDTQWAGIAKASQQLPNATLADLPGLDHAQGFWLIDEVLPEITKFLTEVSAESGMTAAELDSETVGKIEMIVEQTMSENRVPGFAIGIIKDGELVYAEGFGVTNLEDGEPVTPQTLFQQAEGSMATTALAVMQLVEAGKIDLDAPITEYLPYFELKDERYKDITVGHILASGSGIPDSGDYMADWENFKPMYDAGATERWVRSLTDMGLLFAPGEGFEYSDMAYAILGDVIAKASGQSYEEYVQENILEPLGMEESTFLLEDVDQNLLASPHISGSGGEMVVAKLPYNRPFAAANNMFTNVEDMAKMAQASLGYGELDGERILSADSFGAMWEAHSATRSFGKAYPSKMMPDWGYGWFIGEIEGHPAYNTFGREHGFHAGMIVIPDENLAVIAMGNGPVIESYYASETAVDVMGTLLNQ